MYESLDEKLKEIQGILLKVKAAELTLDSMTVFLVVSIILQILDANILYATVPALACALFLVLRELRRSDVVEITEEKYVPLREKLRTAYDNISRENIIVDDLMDNVSGEMDALKSSSFVNTSKIVSKTIFVVFLTFLLLIATVMDFAGIAGLNLSSGQVLLGKTRAGLTFILDKGLRGWTSGGEWEASENLTTTGEDKLGAEAGGKKPGLTEGSTPGRGTGAGIASGQDIYGEPSSAALGGLDLNLEFHPEYGGEVYIKETKEDKIRENEFTITDLRSAEECIECAVAPEKEALVRRYFERLSEIEK